MGPFLIGELGDFYIGANMGEDMPDRNPGESEADYQRRVLKALTEEMLNPDGSVKAKYADDPLAQYLAEQDVVVEITAKAQDIQAEVEIAGPTDELREKTSTLASTFNAADTVANVIENDELEMVAADGQDSHRSDDLKTDESVDRSSSELGNIPGFSGLA